MDRAAKVKKYRGKGKRNHKGLKKQQPSYGGFWPVLLAVVAFGLLFFLVYYVAGRQEAVISYVTQEELDAMLSFLPEDVLSETIKKEENESKDVVTGIYMKELLQNLGLSRQIQVTEGNEKIKREDFFLYYDQVLDYLDLEESVEKKTVLILKSNEDSFFTNSGELKLNKELRNMDFMEDFIANFIKDFHTYEIYIQDNQIIGLGNESDASVQIPDVTVVLAEDETITFTLGQENWEMACEENPQVQPEDVCTLTAQNGKVTGIEVLQSTKENKEPEPAVQTAVRKSVRVLLLNQGQIYYEQIYISCSQSATVSRYADVTGKKTQKKTKNYKKGRVMNIERLMPGVSGKKTSLVVVKPEKSNGKLFLTDKKGNKLTNGYYGSMYIYRDGDGFYIVNKVNVEKYLYSVIASEMPASFHTEALKAQAVCARSYVYRQMQEEDYKDYHADIDDSTNYQVYNLSEAQDVDIAAVKETAGYVMYAGEELVNAYYFSSSCGYSAGMEIWNQEGTYPYLKAKSLLKEGEKENFDLSSEDAFKAYITNTDISGYDSESRYFRWQAILELSGSLKEIKQRIQLRRSINPENISYYTTRSGKAKKVSSMKGFGGIERIYCSKRGKSGAILALTIQFEFGKVKIMSEYNIRSILGCGLEQITYADGSTSTTAAFLPSAFFSISFYGKNSGRFLLSGGGNGHGMGMSQYGADGMAREGFRFDEILKFYYEGIDIRKM